MPFGDGTDYVIINNEELKQVGKSVGDVISVQLADDKSKYGMPCPEEFEELLKQDPDGEVLFHALTPGLQRSILHVIGKPKGSETRLKKGLVALEYLKATQGKFDFREYNEAYRNFRF